MNIKRMLYYCNKFIIISDKAINIYEQINHNDYIKQLKEEQLIILKKEKELLLNLTKGEINKELIKDLSKELINGFKNTYENLNNLLTTTTNKEVIKRINKLIKK